MTTALIKIIAKHFKAKYGLAVNQHISGEIHISTCIGPDPSKMVITTQIVHHNSRGMIALWLWGVGNYDKWREERYNVSDPELLTKLTNEIQHHHDDLPTSNIRTPKNTPPTPTINA